MEDLSLHILDIVENSIAADAKNVEITVVEDLRKDLLTIEVIDDGKGMDQHFLKVATDPFVTTRTTRRVGLGLSLFAESAKMANGTFEVRSRVGQGTTITATFQHSHIDRKPLGNIAETLITLIIGNPDVNFRYRHLKEGLKSILDTKKIRERLDGIPINSPQGIGIIRKSLEEIERTGVVSR